MNRVAQIEVAVVAVSSRTDWVFLRVTRNDGAAGIGECSDAGPTTDVVRALATLAPQLIGQDWDAPVSAVRGAGTGERHLMATIASGLEMARWDVAARDLGKPLWQALGGRDTPVDLYANINRGVTDRTCDGFATAAAAAIAAGFNTVKCAPFDDPPPAGMSLVEAGIRRARAVRQAIGEARLLVDLHYRLTYDEVLSALPAFEELHLGWLEDAVPLDRPDQLLRLARVATVPLAGGEQTLDMGDLAPALATGALRFVLLDVKHAGGVSGTLAVARAAAATGAQVSLHNPTGPVGTATSLHVCAAVPGRGPLEYGFGEVPWREELVKPRERIVRGRCALPALPGLGIDLDNERVRFQDPSRALKEMEEANHA